MTGIFAVLQLGRFNNNEKDWHGGGMDIRDYNMVKARIVQAIQRQFSLDECEKVQGNANSPKSGEINAKEVLTKVYNKYSRRNPALAKQANDFLLEINDYNLQKETKVGFDAAGRRTRDLQDRIAAFLNKVKEVEDNNLEAIIERVNELIADTIPSFESIKEAHGLLITRGFKSEHIENLLNLEGKISFDKEAIFTAVEEIENYIPHLRR